MKEDQSLKKEKTKYNKRERKKEARNKKNNKENDKSKRKKTNKRLPLLKVNLNDYWRSYFIY